MLWSLVASVSDKEKLFQAWDAPLIALSFIGFVVGVVGHVIHSRTVVVIGIAMVFIAVLLFPIVLYLRGTP